MIRKRPGQSLRGLSRSVMHGREPRASQVPVGRQEMFDVFYGHVLVVSKMVTDDQALNGIRNVRFFAAHGLQHVQDAEGHIVVTENSIKKLSGFSFCFTGELSIKRSVAEKMVKELGGSIKSSVVKGLSYLVTNDTTSGSAKNKKAQSLGIPVINEEEFNRLLQE